MKTYRPDDLNQEFHDIIEYAQAGWDILVNKYIEENKTLNGMYGSCVVGDGIYIKFIPKGKRKPRDVKILRTGSAAIGSLPWESTKDEILTYLKSEGIDCFYSYGRLD